MFNEGKFILKKVSVRMISVIMVLAMICTLMTVTTLAADNKGEPTRNEMLKLVGVTETTDKLNTEGWKWEPKGDGGTLTLRNFYIRSTETSVLYLPGGNIHIVLEGENTFETTSSNYGSMVFADGNVPLNVTISEGTKGGKLNIFRQDTSNTGLNPYGFGGDSITIKSGDIYANVEFCTIKDNFIMQGGSLKVEISNIKQGNGIYSLNGLVNISGGKLDINAGQTGIYIPGNDTKPEEGEQKVALTAGDIKIRSGLAAIYAKNIIVDTNGAVDLQGDTTALYCSQSGGTLEILSAGSLTLNGKNPYLPKVTGGGKTVLINAANYTVVDAAIANIPPELSNYTDDSVKSLNDAKQAVVRDKNIVEQKTVNGYATTIENAIRALTYKDADYTKVDEALAKIPSDLSIYTEASVKALNDAKDAIVLGKNITEQNTVNGYATALEAALANLKKKPIISITNQETGVKIEYEDGTPFIDLLTLSIHSKSQSEMDKYKSAVEIVAPGMALKGLYDISLLKDGVAIQPDGMLRVSIPLSDELKAMEDLRVVYIDDKDNVTVIPSEVKAGKIVFVTNHFSYYGIIGKTKVITPDNPTTGDNTSIVSNSIIAMLSAISLFVMIRKRKVRK